MKKYICNDTNYQIGGTLEETISLPISIAVNLPKKIEVKGRVLSLRTSFHLCLLYTERITKKYASKRPGLIANIVSDFCEFTKINPIKVTHYHNEFRLVSLDERRSIIVMCDVSNLDTFIKRTNQKYQINIEYPPTHVTLYTLQINKGIFITDSADLRKITKIVSIPELAHFHA